MTSMARSAVRSAPLRNTLLLIEEKRLLAAPGVSKELNLGIARLALFLFWFSSPLRQ